LEKCGTSGGMVGVAGSKAEPGGPDLILPRRGRQRGKQRNYILVSVATRKAEGKEGGGLESFEIMELVVSQRPK